MRDAFLLGTAIFFCAAALILLFALAGYKRQLRSLIKQLDFIKNQDTNQVLTTQVLYGDVNLLAAKMNDVLQKHRHMELDLRRVNDQFKDSITSISHDLRTPLTSMSGYLQMLSGAKLPAKKRQAYLHIVEGRLASLEEKLNQLFLYARIAGGEMPLKKEAVPLGNLLRDCISEYYDDFLSAFGEPSIAIPDTPCMVAGDREAVTRIIENLLKNALAHGTGDMRIALFYEPGRAHLLFANRTDSIDPQDVTHLFERFYTTDRSRTKKTTGLGLSIARHMTEEQGGSIRAELRGEHLEIHVWLPLWNES